MREIIGYIMGELLKPLHLLMGLSTPPLNLLPRPTIPVGPKTWPDLSSMPRSRPRLPAWVRVMPHQLRGGTAHIKPFFAIFLTLQIPEKIIKKSKKIINLKKFITSFLELFFASNFLHWITNFFIFNPMSPEI